MNKKRLLALIISLAITQGIQASEEKENSSKITTRSAAEIESLIDLQVKLYEEQGVENAREKVLKEREECTRAHADYLEQQDLIKKGLMKASGYEKWVLWWRCGALNDF